MQLNQMPCAWLRIAVFFWKLLSKEQKQDRSQQELKVFALDNIVKTK